MSQSPTTVCSYSVSHCLQILSVEYEEFPNNIIKKYGRKDI